MFICRVNKRKQCSNSKLKQRKQNAIAGAIASQNIFQADYYKLEKGHAKQIQRISYTRPSSGVCKGRQSTVVEVSEGLKTWLKETENKHQ